MNRSRRWLTVPLAIVAALATAHGVLGATATTAGPPTDVTAALGGPQATVSWTPAANNGGSMVWANAIYAFSYTGTSQELVTGNPTNIGISGLTPGNWYTFTVTGFNSAGWSTWANWSPWLFIPATPTPTPSPTSAPVTHSVAVIIDPTAQVGFGFTTPDGGPVHVGDRIVWVNQTSAPHGVTWDTTGSPANGPIFGAGTTTAPIVMTSAGTFHYHCTVHGPSMAGTITVLS